MSYIDMNCIDMNCLHASCNEVLAGSQQLSNRDHGDEGAMVTALTPHPLPHLAGSQYLSNLRAKPQVASTKLNLINNN